MDGDYLEACKEFNTILYETFVQQMPGTKIDRIYFTETIDGLEFHVFKMEITYPNDLILHTYMYSRLFDKKNWLLILFMWTSGRGRKCCLL